MPFERLLEDFAEIASDWFWEMDADLRFSYFSSRLAEVAGVEPDREELFNQFLKWQGR